MRPKQTDLVPGKGQFRSRFPQSAQLRLSDNDFSGSPNRHRHHLSATLLDGRAGNGWARLLRCGRESGADLEEDGQPACGAASPRAYQARKHRALSRHRGRRCPQHLGAGRALKPESRPFFRRGLDLPMRHNPALRGCCCQMPAPGTVTNRSIYSTAALGPAPNRTLAGANEKRRDRVRVGMWWGCG